MVEPGHKEHVICNLQVWPSHSRAHGDMTAPMLLWMGHPFFDHGVGCLGHLRASSDVHHMWAWSLGVRTLESIKNHFWKYKAEDDLPEVMALPVRSYAPLCDTGPTCISTLHVAYLPTNGGQVVSTSSPYVCDNRTSYQDSKKPTEYLCWQVTWTHICILKTGLCPSPSAWDCHELKMASVCNRVPRESWQGSLHN
jgi:hypothetical protein